MVAFLRELPDTDWHPLRVTGVVTALKNMDAKTVKAANGAAGSTHAPVAPIIIGGAGLTIMGFVPCSGQIVTGPGHHIRHGGSSRSDYVALSASHAGRARTIVGGTAHAMSEAYGHSYNPVYSSRASINSRFAGTRVMIPLKPHDASTIATVTMGFRIRGTHTVLPKFPKFRVVRVTKDGVAEPLCSPGGAYDQDSFLNLLTAANATAYNNATNYQTSLAYTANQNNVVDLSLYSYFVDFIEETPAPADSPTGGTPILVNVYTADGQFTQILRTTMVCSNILTMAPQ